MITQNELQTLTDLRAEKRRLDDLIQQQADQLKARMAAREPIEPGAWRAEVRSVTLRLLNCQTLTPILGAEEVARLQSRVEPILQHSLHVRPAQTAQKTTRQRRRQTSR